MSEIQIEAKCIAEDSEVIGHLVNASILKIQDDVSKLYSDKIQGEYDKKGAIQKLLFDEHNETIRMAPDIRIESNQITREATETIRLNLETEYLR